MTQVRDAQPRDLDAVVALDADLFGADSWSPAVMTAEFAATAETRQLVVARSGARVTGYAIVLTVGEVADLQRIGVARDEQRRGLGSLLMAALTTRAEASGCVRMLLEVGADNSSAVAFYQRFGFQEIARRPGYYRTGTDAVVMERDLAGRTTRPQTYPGG